MRFHFLDISRLGQYLNIFPVFNISSWWWDRFIIFCTFKNAHSISATFQFSTSLHDDEIVSSFFAHLKIPIVSEPDHLFCDRLKDGQFSEKVCFFVKFNLSCDQKNDYMTGMSLHTTTISQKIIVTFSLETLTFSIWLVGVEMTMVPDSQMYRTFLHRLLWIKAVAPFTGLGRCNPGMRPQFSWRWERLWCGPRWTLLCGAGWSMVNLNCA